MCKFYICAVVSIIIEFLNMFLSKTSGVKFHEYLSCGSRVIPCAQTDMMKLIVIFHNVTKAPEKRDSDAL